MKINYSQTHGSQGTAYHYLKKTSHCLHTAFEREYYNNHRGTNFQKNINTIFSL